MLGSTTLSDAAIDCRDVYGDEKPFFKYKNDEWYWIEDESSITITIRGSDKPTNSDGFLDWIKNLDTRLIQPWGTNGPWIARGFHFAQLKSGFLSMQQEFDRDKGIEIRGHSRGGAIALTLAVDLIKRGYDVRRVFTFGAPRVSRKWIPELRSPSVGVWQFCAYGDPVWRCPFFPPLMWRHSGLVNRIGSFWNFQSLKHGFGWIFPNTRAAIQSHLMENYIKLLRISERKENEH